MDINQRPLYPRFNRNITTTSTSDTIFVNLNVSSPGTITCGALLTVPTSAFDITQAGTTVTATFPNQNVVCAIKGLYPATAHTVYCLTRDFSNHVMGLAESRIHAVRTSTKCCRALTLTSSTSRVFADTSGVISLSTPSYFVGVNAPSPSSQATTVQLNVRDVDCGTQEVGSLSQLAYLTPSTIVLARPLTVGLPSAQVFHVFPRAGCYLLEAVDVSSRPSFQSSYLQVNVLDDSSPLPAPQIRSALMAGDGLSAVIYMDSPTDRGESVVAEPNGIFSCSLLLHFPPTRSVALTTCQWSTNQKLMIYFETSDASNPDDMLTVGDWISFLPNTIRANCLNPKSTQRSPSCAQYPFTVFNLTQIQFPLNPITPSVVLNVPSTISSCGNLLVDPTQSSGSAGHPWTSVTWMVNVVSAKREVNSTSLAKFFNVSAVNRWLRKKSVASVVSIPNNYFRPGTTYSITLSLQNVFQQISVATATFSVSTSSSTPTVSIAGPAAISTYRTQSITFFAVAIVPRCSANSSISAKLSYDWRVYNRFTFLPGLAPTSTDPRYFIIPPYQLNAAIQYSVKVTVSGNGESSSYVVKVNVNSYDVVVATIVGGNSRIVGSTTPLELDASTSYDMDYPDLSPANLAFTWKGFQITPTYGQDCGVTISSFTYQPVQILHCHNLPSSQSNFIYNFSVTVVNAQNVVGVAFVVVTVIQQAIPVVMISSGQVKYNSANRIELDATVTVYPGGGSMALAKWTTDSAINLPSSVLGSLTKTLSVGSTEPISTTFPLTLQPNILTPGLTYTFLLSATYGTDFSQATASISITIIVNKPPINGRLSITPPVGVELNTSFYFQTLSWTDDPADFPLNFAFSLAQDPSFSPQYIKTFSSVANTNAVLSRGLALNDYVCLAFAYAEGKVAELFTISF